MRTILGWLGAALAVAFLVNGCAKKTVRQSAAAKAGAESNGRAEADLRGENFTPDGSLQRILFPYDRDTLEAQAREALKKNASVIKSHPRWQVLVEGHCDERGTAEYNLALGQRRARAVRDYYLMLGIPGAKIATVSFGKEKPACAQESEACRSANRRAENKIRVQRTLTGS